MRRGVAESRSRGDGRGEEELMMSAKMPRLQGRQVRKMRKFSCASGRSDGGLNGLAELVEIDRLDEMQQKPGLGAAGDVFVHAVAAEANSLQAVGVAKVAHELQAVAVGKA